MWKRGFPNELQFPLIPILFHSRLTDQLFRCGPPPIRLAPRPAHSVQVLESPATSSTCQTAALNPAPFPGPRGGVRDSRPGRLHPEEAPHGPGLGGPSAQPLRRKCHSPPGCGGPLRRGGVAGRQRASGPAGTWRGRDERCLREGAAETAREAPAGSVGRDRGREHRGQRAPVSEAAFPTQPLTRQGAAPRSAGPSPSCPLLAVAVRA